jgi:hypothetical protein
MIQDKILIVTPSEQFFCQKITAQYEMGGFHGSKNSDYRP